MNPSAHSPEFARLAAAWLDGAASAEEAARLWEIVAQDPDCALEFAAQARFDLLLEQTLRERNGASEVAGALTSLAAQPQRIKPARRPLTMLPLAAALVLLGVLAWLLWPAHEPQADMAHKDAEAAQESTLVRPIEALAPPSGPRAPAGLTEPEAPLAATEIPLVERLDRFYLRGVDLDKVPLQRALGLLQGQLLELNFLDTGALEKLRITLPTDAASRRVTFRSGPISFLKALRAVAALGGCDLSVDEPNIALILHREIYPQLANKKDVLEILAALTSPNGQPGTEDANLIAALMADAAALGIALDPNRPLQEQGALPMTRGQRVALQALAEARVQLGNYQAPAFQLYFTEGAPTETNRVIDQEEVPQLRTQLQQLAAVPPLVVIPAVQPFAPPGAVPADPPVFTIQPVGELAQVTVNPPSQSLPLDIAAPSATGSSGVLQLGQGATLRMSADSIQSLVNASGMRIHSGTLNQIILLPVENPPNPP